MTQDSRRSWIVLDNGWQCFSLMNHRTLTLIRCVALPACRYHYSCPIYSFCNYELSINRGSPGKKPGSRSSVNTANCNLLRGGTGNIRAKEISRMESGKNAARNVSGRKPYSTVHAIGTGAESEIAFKEENSAKYNREGPQQFEP